MSDARKEDFASALRADIVRVLVRESGAPETHAIAMASKILQAVSQRWQGDRPYIGVERYDEESVVRDLRELSLNEVCRKHGISRWTVRRIKDRNQQVTFAQQSSQTPLQGSGSILQSTLISGTSSSK